MTATPAPETIPPWYRQAYVWLLIAFPAISVAAGLTTLFIAFNTYDGLVVDDYYKRGMEINRELDRDHAAAKRGFDATVELEPDAPLFRVLLAAGAGQAAPAVLNVSFLHRTRAGFDQITSAALLADSAAAAPFIYQGPTPKLVRGNWDILIEAGDWRLLDSATIP
ncbi:MAG: hypothetical protein A3H91_07790 [Gammaproteobacteria bacterium RIFCSPLOWO2_02_FULL_61_13]|nr:MAG: hypothetical protein A3H91_07790 [Gammaproteobacteria bacterium RIFCSPLOWO2_02_FULL_61_13]